MMDSDLFAETTLVANVSSKLPWHTDIWSGLTRDPERVAHGLLLLGRPGLGKGLFAHRFAQWLLCLAPVESSEPCGGCQSCQLFAAGTHPDFVLLKPAEEGRAITVDQIRELNSFLALKPHTAKRKVVVIDPADGMNVKVAARKFPLRRHRARKVWLGLRSGACPKPRHRSCSLSQPVRRCGRSIWRIREC